MVSSSVVVSVVVDSVVVSVVEVSVVVSDVEDSVVPEVSEVSVVCSGGVCVQAARLKIMTAARRNARSFFMMSPFRLHR